jgi:cell division protein FtsB
MWKYAIALWIAVLFYALTSFLVGADGVYAQHQLQAERNRQKANITVLQTINDDLTARRTAWARDRDTLTVRARELGYGAKNERFIRIVGRTQPPTEQLKSGDIYIARVPASVSNRTLVVWSVVVFFLFAGAFVAAKPLRARRAFYRESRYHEPPTFARAAVRFSRPAAL